jgi:hypothetical protein
MMSQPTSITVLPALRPIIPSASPPSSIRLSPSLRHHFELWAKSVKAFSSGRKLFSLLFIWVARGSIDSKVFPDLLLLRVIEGPRPVQALSNSMLVTGFSHDNSS